MRNNGPVTHNEYQIGEGQTLVSTTDLKSRIQYCNPSFIEVKSDRAQYWLSVGAQPTEQVEAPLNLEISMSLLKPVLAGPIVGKGRVVSVGRTIAITEAELVIGAVLVPGAAAPKLVTREQGIAQLVKQAFDRGLLNS